MVSFLAGGWLITPRIPFSVVLAFSVVLDRKDVYFITPNLSGSPAWPVLPNPAVYETIRNLSSICKEYLHKKISCNDHLSEDNSSPEDASILTTQAPVLSIGIGLNRTKMQSQLSRCLVVLTVPIRKLERRKKCV